ncbi:MAG: hypothetical protein HC860_15455 [Alkalinema sp. RU_4_3]|nr:hypothetical protein [Alkalinema sp. RU_4_3]
MKMRNLVGGLVGLFLVLGLGTAAKAEAQLGSRAWMTDAYTDSVFYKLNPELNGRKLGSGEVAYIREWNMIRATVSEEMEYKDMCGDKGWFLKSFDVYNAGPRGRYVGTSLDRVADAVFYYRNPDMEGQKINPSDRNAVRLWNQIRETVTITDPCD